MRQVIVRLNIKAIIILRYSHKLVIVRTGLPSSDWDDSVIPNFVLRDLGYGPRDA